ncbi:extracellular solute-binding protein [Cohnella sp. GCM10020058]|uniref:extracellular solute-binding protein n=1 Tax=Cohnella sp. GCM10020058 TaxID=3317330 RepID=UPI003632137A
MSKGYGKKIVGIATATTLAAALLAGCSGDKAEEGSAAPSGASASASAGTGGEPVEIEMFVNHSWWQFKDWSGKVPEEITKRTGVKLKVTVASDDKQLPLMLASDNLPELVFTDKELTRMATPAASLDWNSLIAQYAPDWKVDPAISGLYTQADGKFYTMLNNYSTEQEWNDNKYALPNGPALHVRSDIMEALGNPQLNTLDDLTALLGKVKAQYPDMIPLVSKDVLRFGYLNAQFGLMDYPLEFYEDGQGGVKYFLNQPGKLDAYKYINSLYRDGYLTGENFSYKEGSSNAEDLVKSGKAFAIIDIAQTSDRVNAELESLGKEYRMKPVPKPIGDKAAFYQGTVGWSGVFITKNNKHPAESIKLMQFLFSEEGQRLAQWGIEGEDWTMNADGYPEFKYNTQDADYQLKNGNFLWGLLGGSAVNEGLKNYNPKLLGTEVSQEIKAHYVHSPALGLLDPQADSEERTIMTKLRDMINNEQVKVYMAKSEADAEAAYKDLQAKAKTIGVDKLEAWANERYRTVVANMK